MPALSAILFINRLFRIVFFVCLSNFSLAWTVSRARSNLSGMVSTTASATRS